MPHGERGVQRAGPRLNRAFLAALALREENALLSYGFSLCKKPAGCVGYIPMPFPFFLPGCCTHCTCFACCTGFTCCDNFFPFR